MSGVAERKQAFFAKVTHLVEQYDKILIVGADNVGSNQMSRIRKSLRGKAIILMGKNTMVRKALRGYAESNPQLQEILYYIRGNIGLVFVIGDLSEAKRIIEENKVAAPAKPGSIANVNVIVPAGPTGMEPTQTSFLQALNIPSKIAKGQVDIISDVQLITAGTRVGNSEAALLEKLKIKPFKYGLQIQTVYENGSIYEAKVLDISDADILAKFAAGVKNIASVSLALRIPTIAALPHLLIRAYKNILSVGLGTEYKFPQLERLSSAAAAPAQAPAKEEAKSSKPAKEEPKEEEEEEDMGFGLFD